MTSIKQLDCKIINHTQVADGYFKLTFHGPEIAAHAKPTQFVNVKVSHDLTPLLRKPFSIYDNDGENFSVLYKVYGDGSAKLSKAKVGDHLDVLGPLGRVPEVNTRAKTALIAGGVGIASVMALAKTMPQNFDLFYGVRSQNEVAELDNWKKLANQIFIASDDGSIGQKGFVTTLFSQAVSNPSSVTGLLDNSPLSYDQLYCCGPHPMMHALYKVCPDSITPYFLMEEYMACGFGICVGCVVNTHDRGYVRICKEGPVMDGRLIAWD